MWAKAYNYSTGTVLHLKGISSYIWARTHTHRHQNTHTLSMLEAGGSDLSKGFLLWPVCQTVWRAVEGLASPRLARSLDEKASNICFPWHSDRPLLSSVPPLFHLSRRITGRNWTFDPALLYPSDKARSISFSPRLPRVSHSDCLYKKIRVKPFSLSAVWCLRLSMSLPGRRQDSWVTDMWEVNSISRGMVQRRS